MRRANWISHLDPRQMLEATGSDVTAKGDGFCIPDHPQTLLLCQHMYVVRPH